MKKIKTLLLLAVLVGTLSECKKGEDDPFFSFRTRKNRVVGNWILTSGTEVYTSADQSSNSTTNVNYTEKNYSYTSVTSGTFGGTYSDAGVFSGRMSFKKDGTYTIDWQYDGDFTHESGEWNFAAGVGDLKKGEQIVLSRKTLIDNSNNGGSRTTSRGATQSFMIKELRNRTMVIYGEETETSSTSQTGSNPTSESNSLKVEYTLEQPKEK